MEAPLPISLSSPQKRPHVDEAEPSVSTPNRNISSASSTPLTVLSSMATPSPVKQSKNEAAVPTSSTHLAAGDAPVVAHISPTSSSAQQPPKRRKITPQEREAQAKEKDAKAQAKKAQKEAEEKLKAEQKAQRDEEKRKKEEEEKRKKEEEKRKKEEEKRKKEEEKRKKEEEKRKKEEEKHKRDEEKRKKNEEKEEKKRAKELKQLQEEEEKKKKERSQMRLNSFFIKPKTAVESKGQTVVEPTQIPSTGQTSSSADLLVTSANAVSPSRQKKNAQSDYDRVFLPFSLPPTAILAPSNALLCTPEDLAAAQSRLEDMVSQKDIDMEGSTLESIRSLLPKCRRGLETKRIAEIVDQVNGSADNPIDLTEGISAKPLDMLKQIPMKYLHFGEDVRPPYFGTYTKLHDAEQERKVARNPIYRGLADLNYDYDSEAEWEEPGEGEDLDSEGEEDVEDDGDEDLDGFLDDEGDPDVKRRLVNGDQEPTSTGLCWEDASGVLRLNDGSDAISTEFRDFRMGFLLESQQPIDPFSDAYWVPEPLVPRTAMQAVVKGDQPAGAMNPPRLPLTTRPVNGLLNSLNGSGIDGKSGKAKRTIPVDLLPQFKAEVEGSDLTKIGMIEALKKKFPKQPKDALTNTLTEVAQRIGPSASQKRWVLFT